MEIEKINEYIDSLELPPIPEKLKTVPKKITTFEDSTESAEVNDGSIISFTANLTGQQKSDVQNSALLAQLAATKQFDRFINPIEWSKKYVEVLSNIAWVIQEFNFTKFNSASTSFKMDKVMLEIIGAVATGNELLVLKKTIDALGELDEDSKQMSIWNSGSSNLDQGNFQLIPVTTSGEDVVMPISSNHFKMNSYNYRFLWFEWNSSDMELNYARQVATLNEGIYSMIRNKIIEKLGDRASIYVDEIEI